MNLLKKLSLLTALVAVMFAFNACEEDSVGPGEEGPGSVTALMANSTDDNTVSLKWTAPADLDATKFVDYTVTYYPEGTGSTNAPEMSAAEAGVAYAVTGLDKDKAYTFEVVTNYDGGKSSTASKITWAPAMRFEKVSAETIKVYSSTSNFGSGLTLYDDLFEEPAVATIANIGEWNLGLDTKTSGKVLFGSASALSYGGANTSISSMITNALIPANGINDVYDSQGLDSKTFATQTVDLSGTTPGTDKDGFVLYAKTGTGDNAHYAKLFIKYNKAASSFLFGSGLDQYLEVSVSYQKNAGFPYAKK